jgi:hypothetical protein
LPTVAAILALVVAPALAAAVQTEQEALAMRPLLPRLLLPVLPHSWQGMLLARFQTGSSRTTQSHYQ